MNVCMAGVDHKTPIEIREKFAFTDDEAREALRTLKEKGLSAALISTCNRTELWLEMDGIAQIVPDPASLLCDLKGLSPAHARQLVRRRDQYAATHLFRVAAGLESRIVGEDQILGQVKAAAEMAIEEQSAGAVLNTLLRVAVTAAKQVKTDLKLCALPHNAPLIAAEIARDKLGNLKNRRVLIIGDGAMGRMAAEAFFEAGATVLLTRRRHKAGGIEVPGALRVPYDERYLHMAEADVVVSATSSPHFTIETAQAAQAVANRRVLMVDLAVPRDIDPAVKDLGVLLYDVDSIGGGELVGEDEAMAIWAEQAAKFNEWLDARRQRREQEADEARS